MVITAMLVTGPLLATADEAGRDAGGCGGQTSPPVDVAGQFTLGASTDSATLGDLWQWGSLPVGIAVDDAGSVYWSEYRTNTINRAQADGQRRATVASVDGPLGITVDREGRRLFYAADRHYPRSIGMLTLGQKPVRLVCGKHVNRPFSVALAESGARLCWTESINGRIRCIDTDGEDRATVFDDGISSAGESSTAVGLAPVGIAVDDERGLLYWSDLRSATIVRARIDGSEREAILGPEQGLDFPTALAVDASKGKLYWADPGTETIRRADLDGSHAEVVADAADGVLEPYGLAVDAQRRLLYWTDIAQDTVFRTSIGVDDRSQKVERFFELGLSSRPRAAADEPVNSCTRAQRHAQVEFLRHWVKYVRTCVLDVSASKAIMRSPKDLAPATRTCSRQLQEAGNTELLRTRLLAACDTDRVTSTIDDTLQLGARIIAADLPRARQLLAEIRPFIAAPASVGSSARADALASLDDVVERLKGLDRSPPATISWTLPASGQTTAYAAVTLHADAPITVPDDGTIRAGTTQSYVDNGDGTISDLATGLMWEKKCSGCGGAHDVDARYDRRPGSAGTEVAEWLRMINAEGGTGLAGHDDWRLPQVEELIGLIDYERFNPAVASAWNDSGCSYECAPAAARGCSCTRLGSYWSAESAGPPDGTAPVVAFHLGLVLGQPTSSDAFARAVRGPRRERQSRFIDNGDGTVTDRVTGLMWEKKREAGKDLHAVDRRLYWSYDGTRETIWDWLGAVNRENGGGYAGYDDWRIPNVKELYSLFAGRDRDPSSGAIFEGERCTATAKQACSTLDRGLYRGLYWSSTTFADFPSLALTVGFSAPDANVEQPPEWSDVLRVAGGVEPHEKTLPLLARVVRGPVGAAMR